MYELPKHMRDAALRESDRQIEQAHRAGRHQQSDPNHPKYNNGYNYTAPLFGQSTDDFMSRQYR